MSRRPGGTAGARAEALESRQLFAATVSSPIADTFVTANSGVTNEIDLGEVFSDPHVVGVDLTTNEGTIELSLDPTVAPQTVANFLSYVTSGAYNGTLIHKSVPGVLIQGGGFNTSGQAIPTHAPVANEFSPSRPNATGTIAMAKTGGPDSATSQWFINLTNNPTFDDPANMGGFTVFGTVTADTFSFAQAIGALPTANGTALNPQFDNSLPVLSASAPVTDPNNLVVVTEAATLSQNSLFHYSVVSDNSTLVAARVEGNTLILNYPTPGATGVAHVTVTGAENNGTVASQTFTATVGSPPITFGTGTAAAKGLVFTDAAGHTQTVALSGPGTASVSFAGGQITQTPNPRTKQITVTTDSSGLSLLNLTTTGTTARSKLTFTPSRGTPRGATLDLPGLTTNAPLGSITGTSVRLTGPLTAGGAVGKITFASVNGGSLALNGAAGKGGAAITVGSLANATVTASAPVQSITVRGGVSNSTLTFTAPGVVDLGKLTVSGALANSIVNAAGSIGSVTAASTTGSKVYAGIAAATTAGTALPSTAAEFTSPSRIDSVTFRNTAGTDVAASTLGRLNLGTVSTANGGTKFGVAGHSIASVAGKLSVGGRLSLKKVTSAAALSSQLTKQKVDLTSTDLVIDLIS